LLHVMRNFYVKRKFRLLRQPILYDYLRIPVIDKRSRVYSLLFIYVNFILCPSLSRKENKITYCN